MNLPPDVAGATFMAAGSSGPELATAVIGVFVAKVRKKYYVFLKNVNIWMKILKNRTEFFQAEKVLFFAFQCIILYLKIDVVRIFHCHSGLKFEKSAIQGAMLLVSKAKFNIFWIGLLR